MTYDQPIIGINSDPLRRTGALLNTEVAQHEMDTKVPSILEALLEGRYSYFSRTRGLVEIECPMQKLHVTRLCLNEIFAAEKDVSNTSMYKL